MLVFPLHGRSVAEIGRGTASLLTTDILIQVYTTPPRVHTIILAHIRTHGQCCPSLSVCFIQGCRYCCNYILLFWEWEDCFHWWYRGTAEGLLGLMDKDTLHLKSLGWWTMYTHMFIATAHILRFFLRLTFVKFICNLFSEVCRFI